MKNTFVTFSILSSLLVADAGAQAFTNFIRQIQINSGTEWQVNVAQTGEQLSPLAIDPGGARFELWTVRNSSFTDYLLDHKYVGTYVPQATIVIESEDPYVTLSRTRADRPFTVVMTLVGMSTDPSAPQAARMVKLQHHVQSSGAGGVGIEIERDDANLLGDGYIEENGTFTFEYSLTYVPGTNRSKVRGEERFTVMSLPDYQAPESQLASRYIQIWPVADASISGIVEDQSLRFSSPSITLNLNDLYPDSRTYAQLYPGPPQLGTIGIIVPGSAVVINDAVPQNRVLILDDWDSVIEESGEWTMELLTETPFGVDRLDYVTFTINRNIEVNGTVTTVE